MLTDMDVMDAFAADIRVPPIASLEQIDYVLRDIALFRSANEAQRAVQLLQQAGFGQEGRVSIGVKKLLSMAEMCRQDPDSASDKLVTSLLELNV
jgi:vesicle-fusing ATPase